jgi:hypothetical protein
MNESEQSIQDDGVVWGFVEHGVFHALPKGPMVRAGMKNPPFTVKLPDGRERRIITESQFNEPA